MLVVFPGQGSQKIGMGADAYENFAAAREVFAEVDDAISFRLSDLIFNGTENELKQTQNAQPAIMAVSIAYLRVLQKEFGLDPIEQASYLAGHSLGEYSALCAAGVLTLAETAKILRIRGQAMADACPSGGAMAAIIGLDIPEIEKIIAAVNSKKAVVQIANENSPKQTIISGHLEAVEAVMGKAQRAGAKRALKLEVSGPFHSVLMEKAVHPIKKALEALEFKESKRPIIVNVSAKAEKSGFPQLLIDQLTSKVRWTETIQFARHNGVSTCIEIGPSRVLTGLVKQIDSSIETINLNSCDTLSAFAKAH